MWPTTITTATNGTIFKLVDSSNNTASYEVDSPHGDLAGRRIVTLKRNIANNGTATTEIVDTYPLKDSDGNYSTQARSKSFLYRSVKENISDIENFHLDNREFIADASIQDKIVGL